MTICLEEEKIIENKKQSTKYYVWVKDQAGNVSEVASTTTGTVAGLTDANTIFSKTPNDWTNKDVTVTASTTEKKFTSNWPTGGQPQNAVVTVTGPLLEKIVNGKI